MKRRLTKTDLKRIERSESIVKRRRAIEAKINEWSNKLVALEEECPHYNSWYENKGNSGGWDYEDSYWRDYECEDCGKRWTTDQDYETKKKYPHAVEGKKVSGEWRESKW